MTKQKPKLADEDFRARLLRLEQLGVPVGPVADPSPEPDRLILKQTDEGIARLYELPSGEIGVVIPVEITVLTSGVLIIDRELTTSLDDFPLEFTDSDWGFYASVIDEQPYSAQNLNYLLTSGQPLRPCQTRGIIIANGWSKIPPNCRENMQLKVELFLRDERRNEICSEFVVRLDRILKLKYERKQEIRRDRLRSTGRARCASEERDRGTASERVKPSNDSIDGMKHQKPNLSN
jgi:hypothetical protein